jgi:hypothetical protein
MAVLAVAESLGFLISLSVGTAFSREAATAGTNAHTTYGENISHNFCGLFSALISHYVYKHHIRFFSHLVVPAFPAHSIVVFIFLLVNFLTANGAEIFLFFFLIYVFLGFEFSHSVTPIIDRQVLILKPYECQIENKSSGLKPSKTCLNQPCVAKGNKIKQYVVGKVHKVSVGSLVQYANNMKLRRHLSW